jgi:hypothetical protein
MEIDLTAENTKIRIKLTEKKISNLETWGEMERKEEPENYEKTKLELQYLYGYLDALEITLQTIEGKK